ncbi:TPA: hypothetical protein EYO12_04420 [Candidatus Saccharibacteria bacterium]|nr:hypothetical protein [Candidatus Saccharibacteria bacterium]HIO87720.1 hypothetical protein [Candidatus Saccharibacteria bacterium]
MTKVSDSSKTPNVAKVSIALVVLVLLGIMLVLLGFLFPNAGSDESKALVSQESDAALASAVISANEAAELGSLDIALQIMQDYEDSQTGIDKDYASLAKARLLIDYAEYKEAQVVLESLILNDNDFLAYESLELLAYSYELQENYEQALTYYGYALEITARHEESFKQEKQFITNKLDELTYYIETR